MPTCGMRILGSDGELARSHWAEGVWRSGFGEVPVSLAGRAFFKSHLHNGQRGGTEETMRPNATHWVLGHALIVDLYTAVEIGTDFFGTNRQLRKSR